MSNQVSIRKRPGSVGSTDTRFNSRGVNFMQRRFIFTRSTTFLSEEGDRPTHIIVGAGSAGCVLTNRLSEDAENKILLLEAGPKDHWYDWRVHMPSALMYNLMTSRVNWYYHTMPQKNCNNREMYWPRGRIWGGSSALNAMAYVRGHAEDYNRWGKEGAKGWSYANCLPYFKKAQTHELGGDAYRGDSGPLHVSQGPCKNPLYTAFIDAGVQAGYGYTADMNGYRQEGCGPMDMTVHKGKRWSTSQAYLRPALDSRPNIFTETKVLITRILFKGKRAIGVEYIDKHGEVKKQYADGEVIVCGGAINSPQLLMLSGVGDGRHLKEMGIDVIHDLPGVGQNLQDHLEVYVQQACTKPITLYNKSSWKFPHNMIRIGLQWFLFQTGEGASSQLESGGFVRSNDKVTHPDVQFHFLASTVHDHGRVMGNQHAYQVHVGPMRPTSRGSIKLKSKDPRDAPVLDPNYLSTPEDMEDFRNCIKISRDVFAQSAFDPYRGAELAPGKDCVSDADLNEFIRAKSDSAYHPSCTCKMGSSDDPMAVVDGESMRVWGLEGLRVVDASVMPSMASGNLNAPTIMLAERAADLIKGRGMLEPLNVPVWSHKNL